MLMVKMLWSQATKKFQDFNRNLSFSSSLDARQKIFERFFFPTRAAARVTNERVKSGQDSGKRPSKLDNRKKCKFATKMADARGDSSWKVTDLCRLKLSAKIPLTWPL